MNSSTKKIFIYTIGCELRKLDANKISKYLSKNNYRITNNSEDADMIIFISCAFRDTTTEYSLKKIEELKRYNAELIVGGCLPAIEPEKLSHIFQGVTITTKELDKIDTMFPENTFQFSSIEDGNTVSSDPQEHAINETSKKAIRKLGWFEDLIIMIKNFVLKNRYNERSLIYSFLAKKSNCYIRVSWGCMHGCSYCGIKKAIGRFYSKSLDQCIKEFTDGRGKGYKNFVLTADDIGAYGLDCGSSFPELLDKLTEISGEYEIAIQNLNPVWIVRYIDDLEKILKRQKIKIIEIPIQSGSSRLLHLMNRYSDVGKTKDALLRMKKSYPSLWMYTHYMMGFPTETDGEVQESLSFIKESRFNEGYIFPFSCKSGSRAEKIKPFISEEEISERFMFIKKSLKNAGYKISFLPSMGCYIFNIKNI
jgi:threonylcarbamoyladenosine tRNA methylthiotransferase CDKAL1